MVSTELDHCKIVTDSLLGKRIADEQAFTSIEILSDRLERVRKLHRAFVDIEFSPEVYELREQEMKLALS